MIKAVLKIVGLLFIVSSCHQETSSYSNDMLKLYKTINGKLHYWETWDASYTKAIVHWGVVGETGQNKEVSLGLFLNRREALEKEIEERRKEGYKEFDENKHAFLEIEYKVDGFGTKQDLEKRHKLENHLNQLMGWNGLGHADGGSIGSGTMEVGCVVVDFDIAKKVIEESLRNTEFSDYSEIYRIDE